MSKAKSSAKTLHPKSPAVIRKIAVGPVGIHRINAKAEEHIHCRIASWQKHMIKSAAEASGRQLTEYVLLAAIDRAEKDILEKRVFTMGSPNWDKFLEALDAPPKAIPELKRLLRSKDVFAPAVQRA